MRTFLRLQAALLLLLVPVSTYADVPGLWIYCGNLPGCPSGFVQKFSSVFALLFAKLPAYAYALGLLFIIIGGAYILTSAGESERVTKGKNTITWALIGIFIVSFADKLVGFVVQETAGRLSGTDLVDSVIITLISTILDLFYIALLGVAVFSGMRMVVSFGKEDEFNKGKEGLVYAAIGAIIITLAQQILIAFKTM